MKNIATTLFLFCIIGAGLMAQNTIRIINYFDVKFNTAYYLAWDTKTGKSNQYYWSDNKWIAIETNLPATPLAGGTGNIMFDVYYDKKYNQAYYICWDTKTGKSVQYFWLDAGWKQIETNLPASPLPGAKGDIVIKPYFDDKFNQAYYLVYETAQGKSIQYYWIDGNWSAVTTNLPEVPVN